MLAIRLQLARLLSVIVFHVLLVTGASAVSWTELGDAGDTPLTAQTPLGTGPLHTIIGTLNPAADTDVFRIYIPNPELFAIDMVGTSLSGDDDTELYVLDVLGNLVFNNDDGGPGFLSRVNAGDLGAAPAGIYLIAYNLFSSIPQSNQLYPVLGWTVSPFSNQTGTITLNLTGAEFVPQDGQRTQAVPEPSSLLLLVFGIVGFAARALRQRHR